MKVSQKDFGEFKHAFSEYADMFGLQGYKICFEHKKIDGCFAQIEINEEGKLAVVRLTTELSKDDAGDFCPASHAKHEAIHLLTHKMMWLGECRFLGDGEMSNEWEHLVRVLEKIVK